MKKIERPGEMAARLVPVPQHPDADIATELVEHANTQRALIAGIVELRDVQIANAFDEAWKEGRPGWLDAFLAMLRSKS